MTERPTPVDRPWEQPSSADTTALGTRAAHRLAELCACEIRPGLTEAELAYLERQHGFEFADDHRAFLAAGLPVSPTSAGGHGFPNWRDDPRLLRKQLRWPVEGILFDIEFAEFWVKAWGLRPRDTGPALRMALRNLASAPQMVPIYAHRYLPAGRGSHGHPVLSMWRSDITCAAPDLAAYIDREFAGWPEAEHLQPDADPEVTVPFWRELMSLQ